AEEKLGCHRDTQEDKGFLALRPQKTTSPLRISFSISKTNDPYFKKHCFLYLPPCNMAWRSKLPDSTVLPICQSPMQNWRALLENYQIRLMEKKRGHVFKGWNEGKIYFPPTYKYSENSDRYSGMTCIPRRNVSLLH
ncbi:unnamed protein product, partial [Brassica rapa]